MARGRLISRTLGSSRKFADLQRTAGRLREFCQALYPLIVSNTDDFGRMAGDAFTVKHAVFPTSPRTEEEFQAALVALHNAQLIHLYDGDDSGNGGGVTIQVRQFEPHQPGLSKRTKSRFSEPPVNFQELPGTSRNFTVARARGTELNRTELNRTELNRTEPIQSPKVLATVEVDDDLADEPATRNAEVSAFLRTFCDLFSKHRHGARYQVLRQRDVPLVRRLLQTYPLDRLALMAHALLVAEDDWIDGTDRGIGILSTKASWLDGRLADYEAVHGAIAR